MKLTGTIESDVGYTGHHHHAKSGLIFTWFRAYDAESGRWLSADPIEEEGGINLYGYVGGDPVNYDDEFGLSRSPGRPWVRGKRGPIGSKGNPFVFRKGVGPPPTKNTSSRCVNQIMKEAANAPSGYSGSGNRTVNAFEAFTMGMQWVGQHPAPMYNNHSGGGIIGYRNPTTGRTWRFPQHKTGSREEGHTPTGVQMNLTQPCPSGGTSNYHVSVR